MAKRHMNRVGDLESVFGRLEELVLANSGEDEFEEIFKLVVAKLWDELQQEGRGFVAFPQEARTFEQICGLLKNATKDWSGILEKGTVPLLTPEHLQVCVEVLAPHRLADSTLHVMDSFFEFLVGRSSKGAKGQYFTPRHVVELCVQMLRPGKDEKVLDPACGSGGFLLHTVEYQKSRAGKVSSTFLEKYCSRYLWGFDIDARAVHVAKALMVLAGDGSSNILRLNSLLKPDMGGLFPIAGSDGNGSALTIEDVCRSRLRRHKGFDLILTNPPFAGEIREQSVLDGYQLTLGKQRAERDIIFLERCVELLRPGGRMAIVLPHNKFAVQSLEYVRDWLLKNVRVLGVVGLGRNTFLPHTHQKASVLFCQKRLGPVTRSDANEKIFFAVSERDGKNSKGQLILREGCCQDDTPWNAIDHDFEEIVGAFHEFCRSEGIELGDS